jgi:glutamate racemase
MRSSPELQQQQQQRYDDNGAKPSALGCVAHVMMPQLVRLIQCRLTSACNAQKANKVLNMQEGKSLNETMVCGCTHAQMLKVSSLLYCCCYYNSGLKQI